MKKRLAIGLFTLIPTLGWAVDDAPLPADCVTKLRTQAIEAGVTGDFFDATLSTVQAKPELLEKLNYQPEFKLPIWDYLASLVDEERVRDGQVMLIQYKAALEDSRLLSYITVI